MIGPFPAQVALSKNSIGLFETGPTCGSERLKDMIRFSKSRGEGDKNVSMKSFIKQLNVVPLISLVLASFLLLRFIEATIPKF